MRISPNFFLVGAAKAGTTSLCEYLDQHPEIYMSPIKEPCFFADEVRPEHLSRDVLPVFYRDQEALRKYLDGPMTERRPGAAVLDWESYIGLFQAAHARQKVVGEASVIYLWSPTAAANIAARIPGARILMVLRDPVDRLFSQYLDNLTSGQVRVSFRDYIEAALRHRSGLLGIYRPSLEFGEYCEQVKRYLRLFPRERIHIVLYDDFRQSPAECLSGIFRFLDVDPRVTVDTSVHHHRPRVPRFGRAGYLLKRSGLWQAGRRLLPAAVARKLRPLALRPRGAMAVDANDRGYLLAHYRPDIQELSELLDRDLSAWLR
jgi:hypothetical protein